MRLARIARRCATISQISHRMTSAGDNGDAHRLRSEGFGCSDPDDRTENPDDRRKQRKADQRPEKARCQNRPEEAQDEHVTASFRPALRRAGSRPGPRACCRRPPGRWRRGLPNAHAVLGDAVLDEQFARSSQPGPPKAAGWSIAGLLRCNGMLSVCPTTVMLPISSWFSRITLAIEPMSGSNPSVSCACEDWNSSGLEPWITSLASEMLSVPLRVVRSSVGLPPRIRAKGQNRPFQARVRRLSARHACDLRAIRRRQGANQRRKFDGLAAEAHRQSNVDGGGKHCALRAPSPRSAR